MSRTERAMAHKVTGQEAAFGGGLKRWRALRRVSQLDLALEAGVSARHLAFLETGKARPSREMVVTLGAALDVPLRARNELLLAAGFAPIYPERPLTAEHLAPIRIACATLLARHEPFPAIEFDRHWNLLAANAAAQRLFGVTPPATEGKPPLNIVSLFVENAQLRSAVANWGEVAQDFLKRLRLEAANSGPDATLEDLIASLQSVAPAEVAKPADGARSDTFAAVHLHTPAGELRLFSTIAEFGTVEDITVRDLRVELFFPSDPASAAVLEALAKHNAADAGA